MPVREERENASRWGVSVKFFFFFFFLSSFLARCFCLFSFILLLSPPRTSLPLCCVLPGNAICQLSISGTSELRLRVDPHFFEGRKERKRKSMVSRCADFEGRQHFSFLSLSVVNTNYLFAIFRRERACVCMCVCLCRLTRARLSERVCVHVRQVCICASLARESRFLV